MKRMIMALAAISMMAGSAYAQSAAAPTANNDETVLNNDSSMKNDDAALPGGSEAGAMGTTQGTDPTSTSSTAGSGNSSQPMIPAGSAEAETEASTPSGGIVPGQTPE